MPLQVLFKLPPSAAQQLVAFSAPANAYEALREPHALQAAQLTLTLPGPTALAVLSLAPRGQALNGPAALAQLAKTLANPSQLPQGPAAGDAFAALVQQGTQPAPLQQSAPAEAPALLAAQASTDSECCMAPPSPVRALAQALGRAPGSPRSPSGRRVAAIVDRWPPLPPPASMRQLWAQYQASAQLVRALVMLLPLRVTTMVLFCMLYMLGLLECLHFRASPRRRGSGTPRVSSMQCWCSSEGMNFHEQCAKQLPPIGRCVHQKRHCQHALG